MNGGQTGSGYPRTARTTVKATRTAVRTTRTTVSHTSRLAARSEDLRAATVSLARSVIASLSRRSISTRSWETRRPGDQFLVTEVPALACAVEVLCVHVPPPLLVPALALPEPGPQLVLRHRSIVTCPKTRWVSYVPLGTCRMAARRAGHDALPGPFAPLIAPRSVQSGSAPGCGRRWRTGSCRAALRGGWYAPR